MSSNPGVCCCCAVVVNANTKQQQKRFKLYLHLAKPALSGFNKKTQQQQQFRHTQLRKVACNQNSKKHAKDYEKMKGLVQCQITHQATTRRKYWWDLSLMTCCTGFSDICDLEYNSNCLTTYQRCTCGKGKILRPQPNPKLSWIWR